MDRIYVGSSGPENARIMIVGEAPGGDEERYGKPFVGAAGNELDSQLNEVGLLRHDCFVTNVVRFRPPGNDISYFIGGSKYSKEGLTKHLGGKLVADFVPEHIERLKREIQIVNPNVIVAAGNTALWALTGKEGITKWRRSELECTLVAREDGQPYKVIPILHPAMILRMYSDRFITVNDWRIIKREAAYPQIIAPDYKFYLRPSFKDTVDFLNRALIHAYRGGKVSVDLETRRKHIAVCGIALSKTEAMCIPFMCVENDCGYWSEQEEMTLVSMIRRLLTHANVRIIGQNYNYDRQYIAKHWACFSKLHMDTMVAHHVCFPMLEKGLDFLSSMYCEHHVYWKGEGKEWNPKLPEEQLWAYNCKDCCITFEASDALDDVLAKLGLLEQNAIQQKRLDAILRMMLRGCRRDESARKEFGKELVQAISEREQYIHRILGHDFNPRSPQQMKQLFYGDFKLKPILDRKTKQPTLNEKALGDLTKREPLIKPLTQAIGEVRCLTVFNSTFVEAQADTDGRVRTSYNAAGTATFRWSSSTDAFGSGGNLQNIPKGSKSAAALYCKQNGPSKIRDIAAGLGISVEKVWKDVNQAEEDGFVTVAGTGDEAMVYFRLLFPNVRKLFIPDPDYVIMDWDLDRADLQVVVWEADDADLKAKLRSGADMHSENAKDLGCDRDMAKRFVHGTNYIGSATTMARNCGLTVRNAENMQRRWFAAHPGIKRWHERVIDSLRKTRTVSNQFGYKAFFFDRIDSILPEAVAWGPQSTVAEVINRGLDNLDQNVPEVQVLLQVHDSLVMQVHKSLYPSIVPKIKQALSIVVPYPDPLIIPCSGKASDKSWGDTKDIVYAA